MGGKIVVLPLSLFCHISHLIICVLFSCPSFLNLLPFFILFKGTSWQVGLELAISYLCDLRVAMSVLLFSY